jgi:23S rRNA pseudouridine1911/1915/1917 synthase
VRREFRVDDGAAGERLDVSLARLLGLPRAQAQKLLAGTEVNGGVERASYRVQAGDEVAVELPEAPAHQAAAPDLPVVFEDGELVVVDKPAGLTVHPGAGTTGQATAADYARTKTSDTDPERPGIVHRLDRDTSGLLIIAKTPEAKAHMQAQFKAHNVQKTYTLLAVGRIRPDAAEIRLPVARHPTHGLKQTVAAAGREAVTRYRTTATYPGYTLIEAAPETGRTHQLRVHFAALGHPVAGDTTYGQPKRQLGLRRQFLHAGRLEFTASSGQKIALESPLPTDLKKALQRLSESV